MSRVRAEEKKGFVPVADKALTHSISSISRARGAKRHKGVC